MEIAVLGGGNGAYAAAADLTETGHDVRFWRRDTTAIALLKEAGNRLPLLDFRGERTVRVARVTDDIAAAVTGAALIVCPVPATAQADIAHWLAPHLVDGQVVFLPPGSFGSHLMARIVRQGGNRADIAFAEAGTLPYLVRKRASGDIAIAARATRLPTGVFPRRLEQLAHDTIRTAFPAVENAGDALSGALLNAGPIIHPPLIVANAAPIEHFDHWDIHREGTQPSVRRIIDRLDDERMTVREHLGYGPPHFPLADHYRSDGNEWMYGKGSHENLAGSGDWRERLVLTEHRYMREDVALGLALLVSVADWAGVPVPTARGLLDIGSAICSENFRRSGRTLENLELAHLEPSALRALLHEGLP